MFGGFHERGGRGKPMPKKIMVGNIPDYMTEAMLKPILEEAGTVVRIDMMHRASFGHKGYCFVEYADEASRDTAVRNLGTRAVNGIKLKITPMDGTKDERALSRLYETEQKDVPKMELEATTPIAMALKRLPLSDVFEATEQLKHLAIADEAKAASILKENPQLGMAILHILYYMGVRDRDPERDQEDNQRRRDARKRAKELGLPDPKKRRKEKAEAAAAAAAAAASGAPAPAAEPAPAATAMPANPHNLPVSLTLPPSQTEVEQAPAPAAAPAASVSPVPAAEPAALPVDAALVCLVAGHDICPSGAARILYYHYTCTLHPYTRIHAHAGRAGHRTLEGRTHHSYHAYG